MLVAQLCPTLCNPIDCSPPGSSVHGILQARILESVAIPFSRGLSQPRSSALQVDSLPSEPPGKPCRPSEPHHIHATRNETFHFQSTNDTHKQEPQIYPSLGTLTTTARGITMESEMRPHISKESIVLKTVDGNK